MCKLSFERRAASIAIQLRTSQPSILTQMGTLIQVMGTYHITGTNDNTAAHLKNLMFEESTAVKHKAFRLSSSLVITTCVSYHVRLTQLLTNAAAAAESLFHFSQVLHENHILALRCTGYVVKFVFIGSTSHSHRNHFRCLSQQDSLSLQWWMMALELCNVHWNPMGMGIAFGLLIGIGAGMGITSWE